jgi:2-hydroxychromene-2-carboxylate isomerase
MTPPASANRSPTTSPRGPTAFYFDLGSPYAYLTAERLGGVLGSEALSGGIVGGEAMGGDAVVWRPISLGGLFKANGRSSWAVGDPSTREAGIEEVERRARAYELPELRWPEPWPSNYLFAMRLATHAFRVGRGEAFTLQAFRDAFQRGRDLGIPEQVLQSAEHAGLDPDAARAATEDPQVKQALRAATDEAHSRGVIGVPTLAVGEELFWGDDRLMDAAAAIGGGGAP